MDYKIKYTKEAIAELNKRFIWYRSKELELGERFKNAFYKIRSELKENPKIFKQIENNHRRAVLGSSFPYTVHYLVNEKTKTIKIFGVFHQNRDIELVDEKTKIRKIHELRNEKKLRLNQRQSQLNKIRQRQELEKDRGKERDRGLER
ncbi:type II toxin-antitoxin system RelE/ParE family toxin [Tenacibaculum agarivorans]|uniref:type II toxin-antitoxin system RelE/ParE family toxin n=1 Tax=Tenacibaculum agarivorans TaxID=1908389 RepID=UPI00094BBACC|nr:type II toxin-antitoxin system RelE/ParE family toxin [Tenacibaculum agarivorans]